MHLSSKVVLGSDTSIRYLDPQIGWPVGVPLQPNLSLGDSVAGLHAAVGAVRKLLLRSLPIHSGDQILALLLRRRASGEASQAIGKTVDAT